MTSSPSIFKYKLRVISKNKEIFHTETVKKDLFAYPVVYPMI